MQNHKWIEHTSEKYYIIDIQKISNCLKMRQFNTHVSCIYLLYFHRYTMNKKILQNKTLDALSLSVVNVCDQLQQTNIVPLRSNPDAIHQLSTILHSIEMDRPTKSQGFRLGMYVFLSWLLSTRQYMISDYFDFISDNVR